MSEQMDIPCSSSPRRRGSRLTGKVYEGYWPRNYYPGSPITTLGDDGRWQVSCKRARLSKRGIPCSSSPRRRGSRPTGKVHEGYWPRNHQPGSPITTLGDDGRWQVSCKRAGLSKGYSLLVIPAQAGIQAHRQGIGKILTPENYYPGSPITTFGDDAKMGCW